MAIISPPSQFLPPLKKLDSLSAASISLVHYQLKRLYQPRPTPRAHGRKVLPTDPVADSGYASGYEDDVDAATQISGEAWELARSDPMERKFALQWMTGFIARSIEWMSATSISDVEIEEREVVVDSMSSLLSACAQTSESGDLLREFVFEAAVGDGGVLKQITISLKDADLNADDHTSVGLQTWGSCVVMIKRICLSPFTYGFSSLTDRERPLRILELGAGTGLLSLALGSLCIHADIPAHIIATDYHADVLCNLRDNVVANPSSVSDSVIIDVQALDWQMFSEPNRSTDGLHTQLSEDRELNPAFAEPFDLIVASDVVYQPEHAKWVACTVRSLLRRDPLCSSSRPPACFHIIAPVRPTHERTRASIEEAFNVSEQSSGAHTGDSGPCLRIVSYHDSAKTKSVGRADESEYREYRIKWV